MTDELGNIGRRFPQRGLLVPTTVEVKDGQLVPDYDYRKLLSKTAISPATLTKFLGLNTDKQIQRFAEKWGMLGLCSQHPHEPKEHGCAPLVDPDVITIFDYFGVTGAIPEGPEPLEAWRFHIARSNAALTAAAALQMGRGADDWLDAATFAGKAYLATLPVSDKRRLLASAINKTLRLCGVVPEMIWADERPTLVIAGPLQTLLGVLTFQLLLAICRQDAVVLCDGCRDACKPNERRLKVGGYHYCTRCKADGTYAKHRKQRSRAKQKEKK